MPSETENISKYHILENPWNLVLISNTTKNMLATKPLSLHDCLHGLSITNRLDIKIIMWMTQINRNACQEKLWKKLKAYE